jgi:hypothetical protein
MSSIFDGIGNDGVEQLDENLRKWFKEKWVRFGPDGKIRGACARGDDSEGKPKCLPQKKAQNLGKKGRKYAASKKRREDPNPERTGKAKNVATKKKTNEGVPFDECPKCRGPIVHESMMNEKQDACYHKVKSRYKVWPSAYASGALVQCRKKGASNWGTGGKKNENNVVKGMVNEEYVLTLYSDGKPLSKYGIDQEARQELERLKKKFPNKHFELKREVRGGVGGNEKVSEGVIIGHDKDDPQVAVLGGAGSYKLSNLKKKALGEAKQLAADIASGEYKNSAYNVKQLANTLNTIVAAEAEMEKAYFGEAYDPDDYEPPLQTATHVTIDDISMQRGGDLPAGTELKQHKRSSKDSGPDQRARFWFFVVLDNGYPTRLVRLPKKLVKPVTMHEDYTGEFTAEVTPAINPYGGLKDRKHRGAIGEALLSEMPDTSGPIGVQPGGWRTYRPKPAGEIEEAKKSEFRQKTEQQQYDKLEKIKNSALPQWAKEYLTLLNDPKSKVFKAAYYSFPKGQAAREEAAQYIMNKYKVPKEWMDKVKRGEMSHMAMDRPEDRKFDFDVPSMHEDTAYAGGMGQGGNAGESYRKFKPKSAGTFKEDELDEACWKGYHKEGNKKMFGKTYPNCVKNTNEEQIDELSPDLLSRAQQKAHDQKQNIIDKAKSRNIDLGSYGDPKSHPVAKAAFAKDEQERKFSAGARKASERDQDRDALKDLSPAMKRKIGIEEEQLDEKCWDSHKQVGMKNKGGRQVPNCVPKESSIMKGLRSKD